MGLSINKSPYHDIVLTDIQLHVQKFRKPRSWFQAVIKSLQRKSAGRVYFNSGIIKDADGKYKIFIPLPKTIEREQERARLVGKKLRILIPKDGLPVLAGKDTLEFMNAHPELAYTKPRKQS